MVTLRRPKATVSARKATDSGIFPQDPVTCVNPSGLPLAPCPGSHRGEETAMVRTVAFYGLALAAVALLVQWIEYRHFVRLLPTEIALAAVASVSVIRRATSP
jgi:hypothetical protein